jgi:hypothetical protein
VPIGPCHVYTMTTTTPSLRVFLLSINLKKLYAIYSMLLVDFNMKLTHKFSRCRGIVKSEKSELPLSEHLDRNLNVLGVMQSWHAPNWAERQMDLQGIWGQGNGCYGPLNKKSVTAMVDKRYYKAVIINHAPCVILLYLQLDGLLCCMKMLT